MIHPKKQTIYKQHLYTFRLLALNGGAWQQFFAPNKCLTTNAYLVRVTAQNTFVFLRAVVVRYHYSGGSLFHESWSKLCQNADKFGIWNLNSKTSVYVVKLRSTFLTSQLYIYIYRTLKLDNMKIQPINYPTINRIFNDMRIVFLGKLWIFSIHTFVKK